MTKDIVFESYKVKAMQSEPKMVIRTYKIAKVVQYNWSMAQL